jgi:HEAT repeat protein
VRNWILVISRRIWQTIRPAFVIVDQGLVTLAALFGVTMPTPGRRFAVFLGAYAALYLLALVPVPLLSLAAMVIAYVGVVAVGRSWVANEKHRADIAKKLDNTDPDSLPDLRWLALVSALQLAILFPLLFYQMHERSSLFRVAPEDSSNVNLWTWWMFALDPYGRALFGLLGLPDAHVSAISYDAGTWAARLVLLKRLTFDYILVQGVMRLFAINTTIKEGVAALKQDTDMARRLGRRAVEPLLEALQSPDPELREAAARVLGELRDPRAVSPLIRALEDPVAGVRWQAATALGSCGNALAMSGRANRERDRRVVAALIALLRDPEEVVRSGAISALELLGAPAIPDVLELLASKEPAGVRVAALEVLRRLHKIVLFTDAEGKQGSVRQDAPVKLLLQTLGDPDEGVRKAAVEVLGALQDPQAVEPLRQILRDPAAPTGVRAEAIRSLELMGSADAVPDLVPLLQSSDKFLAKWSARALGKLAKAPVKEGESDPRKQAVPALIAALQNPLAEVREESALALAALGDAETVVGPLIQLLRDSDENVQAAAIKGLETLHDARAVEPLIQLLQQGHASLRCQAAELLGKLGDPRAIAPLQQTLQDGDKELRDMATWSLEKLGAGK